MRATPRHVSCDGGSYQLGSEFDLTDRCCHAIVSAVNRHHFLQQIILSCRRALPLSYGTMWRCRRGSNPESRLTGSATFRCSECRLEHLRALHGQSWGPHLRLYQLGYRGMGAAGRVRTYTVQTWVSSLQENLHLALLRSSESSTWLVEKVVHDAISDHRFE